MMLYVNKKNLLFIKRNTMHILKLEIHYLITIDRVSKNFVTHPVVQLLSIQIDHHLHFIPVITLSSHIKLFIVKYIYTIPFFVENQ